MERELAAGCAARLNAPVPPTTKRWALPCALLCTSPALRVDPHLLEEIRHKRAAAATHLGVRVLSGGRLRA